MEAEDEKEKKYLQTLVALSDYLRKEKTATISLHETEYYSKEETFYDTVITIFFEKEKMLKNFEKDTSVFAVKGKLDMVRHILNECDKNLDITPADSILVEPQQHLANTSSNADTINDSLSVFILKDNKKVYMLTFYFDERTNRILGISM